ncbi:MAG: NUDIX hydrolase [Candidatus Paceibacterota bacterium]
MAISEKDLLNISQKLLDKARKDGIELNIVKLIVKKNDTVLVLRRASTDSFPNLYELPGGGIDKNEDIFSAGRRELYEETGLSIQKFFSEPQIVDVLTVSSHKKCRVYFLNILSEENEIILNKREHSEYKWVSINEVDNLFMFSEVRALIKKNLEY